MRKIGTDGAKIKELREQLDRGSTQKEFAHAVGLSERKLREIENRNEAVPIVLLDRMAAALGVHGRIIAQTTEPELTGEGPATRTIVEWEDVLVPRFDEELAQATMDAGKLFSEASRAHDVECAINVTLNAETENYAQELFRLVKGLSWSQRSVPSQKPGPNIWDDVEPPCEIDVRRQLRQLLVLLKGNDVWVYENTVFRRLPERFSVAEDDAPADFYQARLYVTLGPPGEYGETTLPVPVDHGQPFVLKAFRPRRRAAD